MRPHRAASILLLAAVAASAAPALAHAQNCFRGRPLPTCGSFWITESGIAKRLTRNPFGATDDLLATLEVGRMRNRSERTALGATALLAVGDQFSAGTDAMLGVKARYRRWLSPTTSLELAPGVFYNFTTQGVGLTAHGAFNLGDWAALTGQVMAGRNEAGNTDVGLYVGGKLGSYPGTVAGIATPLGIVVLYLFGAFADD